MSTETLSIVKKMLRADESGRAAVTYLESKNLPDQIICHYMQRAEYEIWIGPWEGCMQYAYLPRVGAR